MKNIDLQSLVDDCYQEFIFDETIIGFNGLLKSKGLGSKRIIKLRNLIYEKYGKERLVNIYRNRLARLGQKSRPKDYKHSEYTIKKIKESNTKYWKNINENRREISRQSMVKFCTLNSHSPQTNVKRIKSRRAGAGWKDHSTETKNKMSIVFKNKWKSGDYENRVKSFSSKSQIEIEDIIRKMGYSVEGEYFINGRPYDVFVKEKNLIIEYNGTYWHFDPKVYDKNHFDKGSGMYAYQIWERDRKKIEDAKKFGYNVLVVWEREWQRCQDKVDYIKKLLC